MVGEEGKLKCFHEKTEMVDRGVGSKEFSVKGRVFGFGGGKLLGEKGKGGPGNRKMLLKDSTHMRVRCINNQRNGCSGNKVSENGD